MNEQNKDSNLTPEQKIALSEYFKKQFGFFLLALVLVLVTIAFIVIKNLGINIFNDYFLLVVLCTGGLALLCVILMIVYNAKMRSFLKKIEGENRDK